MVEPEKPKALYETTLSTVERMEAMNKKLEEENIKMKKEYDVSLLSGKTLAGGRPEKPKEESPKEFVDRINKELEAGMHQDG